MKKRSLIKEVKHFQKIAGLLKEEEDGLSSQNLDRIAGKVKGSGKLKAVYPFENQEKYTWEDFAREVVKQNPDPAGGTPKGGERIYTLEFEDASSVHATFDREDDLKTWEEVVEYYISSIEELYSSVAGFAKVFTWYSWHGPFKDLAGLVYEVTVESRQGIIDTVDGSVGCFILGEANEFIVIDSTWEKGGEMREWEEGDEEKDEEEPYENDMDNLDTSLPR